MINIQLKREILNFILDNLKDFQLHNTTKQKFRFYIYDDKGEYLIGGKQVSEFIRGSIRLLTLS